MNKSDLIKKNSDLIKYAPNSAGKAKIATTIVARGGKAVLRSSLGEVVKETLVVSAGPKLARQILRGGTKTASRLAPAFALVEFGIDQQATKAAYDTGEISEQAYRAETAGNVGNAAGGLGGAAAGAALGSLLLPGVGTVLGGIIGGLFGGTGGRVLCRKIAG